MANVILKNITKIYPGGQTAVDNFSMEIADKEFIVLVGPSGCGKSTILRMIAGLEDITNGEIIIDNKLVNNIPPKDRDIAMVFQNYALYPHMTVYENMAFGLTIRKLPKHEIDKRVTETAEILGLRSLLNRKPAALSGGQKQRVALGRAIVRKPKVFLFDEPLSNLDAKLRVQMRAEISKLHQTLGTTMIYVTHDQTEAMTMGNRIVIMKSGVIQQIDRPLKIYNNPVNKFVAGFIGSPPMNFIEGKLIINGEKVDFMRSNFSVNIDSCISDRYLKYANKNVTLGIRPENIIIGENSENTYNASVDLIEPLGAETIYYLDFNGIKLVARSNIFTEPNLNTVMISFKKKKLHLFDDNGVLI